MPIFNNITLYVTYLYPRQHAYNATMCTVDSIGREVLLKIYQLIGINFHESPGYPMTYVYVCTYLHVPLPGY